MFMVWFAILWLSAFGLFTAVALWDQKKNSSKEGK